MSSLKHLAQFDSDITGPASPLRRALPFLFLAALVVAKFIYVFGLRIDSDETQHLHVVWGWSQGSLPYRDFFDNHSPLFQVLCVPLFRALGERADIIIPMRFAVVPLYLLCLWCVYRCGTHLLSREFGRWAAVCAGAWPPFFTTSTEFRTDDLWAAFWLLSMVALTRRPLCRANAFLFGLAIGASFATSMKTSALALSMMAALLVLLGLELLRGEQIQWRKLGLSAALALLGLAAVPSVVIAFFAFHHALPDLYYGTIQHNLLTGLAKGPGLRRRIPAVLASCAVGLCGYISCGRIADRPARKRMSFVALTTCFYLLLIGVCWPLVQAQDFIPIAPLGILVVLSAIQVSPTRFFYCPPVFAALEILILFLFFPPKAHAIADKIQMISNVLKLTTPQDFVMDAKGESVFRRRPFYYVLESITLHRIQLNLIHDDIPERLVTTHTAVAINLRMPVRARRFLEENYLPIGFRMRVLGQILRSTAPGVYQFNIAVPARYTFSAEHGLVAGRCDGTPLTGPCFLDAGSHQFQLTEGTGKIAIFWTTAFEKGFSPFWPSTGSGSGETQ